MKNRVLALLLGTFLAAAPARAQEKLVTGRITNDQGSPLPGVSVEVRGAATVTTSTADGFYSLRASVGQTLNYRRIGYNPVTRIVGAENVINVQLPRNATSLDAMVVTALGETRVQRSLGVSQQTVSGADIAQTGRENFINSLQGRVAGVEVVSTSGVIGSSASITIRGVSSISSSNQPLMIIDGLPMDNKTLNTNVLASDAPGSSAAFNNRGVDFTNRGADINPEDIESLVVLKGPEAAALYGIDAANGAIVITTKRGRAGVGGLEYSNDFRVDQTRGQPALQSIYGPTGVTGTALNDFQYFGNPYTSGTPLFDNVDGFFRKAVSQRHNLTFSGAAADNRVTYRVTGGLQESQGVVPGNDLTRVNLNGFTGAQVTKWIKADLSMQYSKLDNVQPNKGAGGALIGALLWPQTDDAKNFLTAAGLRRRVTNAASGAAEVDNPYFSVSKNRFSSATNRLIANFGLVLTPFSWGNIKTNIGSDSYTDEKLLLRHPESALGNTANGLLDVATDVTRRINVQTLFNINPYKITENFSVQGLVGNQINDERFQVNAIQGRDFLDPNFVSVNNTLTRSSRTTLNQRRLIGLYGQAVLNYSDYLYLTLNARNDWTSTIPAERNSFFYPSAALSFVASDAFPALGRVMTAKLRASRADVGRDARPYAFRPALESKTTSYGGYGYGFTGPNLALKPEFASAYEFGGDFGFFQQRLGVDITTYRKETRDQIVNDIRGSYATGFILFNLNGAKTRNEGLEVTVRATPFERRGFSWDVQANFERARGRTLALPNELPESYVSDTWLYGNVRNGTTKGLSTRSLTGLFYLRDTIPGSRKILIDPTTGLPLRSTSFIDAGYDRQPDFTVGLTNTFRIKQLSVSMLLDFRRGGDVLNATQHFLTTRGLSERTLDRDQPRVIDGVLRDGKENTANPTKNTIVVIPAVQPQFYAGISEELFIEKDINWVRLRDVTVRYQLPGRLLKAREASVFVRGTDLFLITNYSGLDPIVNGNTAAVGGSGAAGIDFGNFPMPRGLAFGLKMGY